MKIGIMQPYFFPYLGYWQLMNAVDKYVIYDDVNYIKRGWINKNNILINGEAKNINLILSKVSQFKHINDITIIDDDVYKKKLYTKIKMAYSKAPYYTLVMPILEKIIFQEENNLAKYLTNSFKLVNEYLGINTELILSSKIEKNNLLKGEEKIINICKILGATEYYNAIGGIELYNKNNFSNENIKLSFLKMNNNIIYKQFNNTFVSNLSIIDVMMFNNKTECKDLLLKFTLV